MPDGGLEMWHTILVTGMTYNAYGDTTGYRELDLYSQMETVFEMQLYVNHAVHFQIATTYDHDGYIDHLTGLRRGVGDADVRTTTEMDLTGRRIGDVVREFVPGGISQRRAAALDAARETLTQMMDLLDDTKPGNLVAALGSKDKAVKQAAIAKLEGLLQNVIADLEATGSEDLVHFAVFFKLLEGSVSKLGSLSTSLRKKKIGDFVRTLQTARAYSGNYDDHTGKDEDDIAYSPENEYMYVQLEWDPNAELDQGKTDAESTNSRKWTARYALPDTIKEVRVTERVQETYVNSQGRTRTRWVTKETGEC